MKFIASSTATNCIRRFYTSTKVIPTSIFTSSLAIMKWLLRAEETGHQRDRQETRSQEGHAVVPRRLLQPSFRQCGHTRLGPRRQRLTPRRVEGQQEYAIKIAAAESAVLDSARAARMNAAKQEKANADAARCSKEAQSTRSSRASQRCNAGSEATASSGDCEIYDQAEALLAQYGLADVPPQPPPPQKGVEATQRASSGYERIPIERES